MKHENVHNYCISRVVPTSQNCLTFVECALNSGVFHHLLYNFGGLKLISLQTSFKQQLRHILSFHFYETKTWLGALLVEQVRSHSG